MMSEGHDFREYGWDCAVDWVSATTPAESSIGLYRRALAMASEVQAEFYPVQALRPARRLGYEGVVSGGIFVGQRHDGFFVSCSSRPADKVVRWLDARVWRLSRLDIAFDLVLGFDADPLIRELFEEAVTFRDRITYGFRKRVRLVDGAGDGDTLYIGSRSSGVFMRVYNKEKESGEPRYKGVVRFEVQFNGPVAADMGKKLAQGAYNVSVMAATTLEAFRRAGVDIRAGDGTGEYVRWHVQTPKVDDDAQVKWLKKQVGPVARRLENFYGEGFIADILELRRGE